MSEKYEEREIVKAFEKEDYYGIVNQHVDKDLNYTELNFEKSPRKFSFCAVSRISEFSIECSKSEINHPTSHILKENFELKKLNEILEREINLLKSLLLINNLNLNTTDSKTRNKSFNLSIFYF